MTTEKQKNHKESPATKEQMLLFCVSFSLRDLYRRGRRPYTCLFPGANFLIIRHLLQVTTFSSFFASVVVLFFPPFKMQTLSLFTLNIANVIKLACLFIQDC